MIRDIRNLGHSKQSKIKSLYRPPEDRDGSDGDIAIYNGRLYVKDKNIWHSYSADTGPDLPGGLFSSGTLTVGGTVTVNAAAVFNEGSGDYDFRVEGNGDANLLFCDAGNDRVGIGTASPENLLHIQSSGATRLQIDTTSTAGNGTQRTYLDMKDGENDGWRMGYYGDDAQQYLAFQSIENDGFTDVMVLEDGDSGGKCGIGTVTPEAILHVKGASTAVDAPVCTIEHSEGEAETSDTILKLDSTGDANLTSAAVLRFISCHDSDGEIGYLKAANDTQIDTAFTQSSDIRLKKNIIDTSLEGLKTLNKIKVRDFEWNDKRKRWDGHKVIAGFIADEMYDVYPAATDGTPGAVNDDGSIQAMGVCQGNLISLMLKAIQELSAKVTAFGSAMHVIAIDQDIRFADATDFAVIVELSGYKIPAKAIITRVAAVVVTDSNLATHNVNICMSTDTGFTIDDAALTNRTELLGAGVANTDSTDSPSASDIDMGAGNDEKDVWICNDVVRNGTSDQYIYVCNAGTSNGNTNSTAGTLSIVIEYYGID